MLNLDLVIFKTGPKPVDLDLEVVPEFADVEKSELFGSRTLLVMMGPTICRFILRFHTSYSDDPWSCGAIAGTFYMYRNEYRTVPAAKARATAMHGWKTRTPNTKTLRELLQAVMDQNSDRIERTGFDAAEALGAFFRSLVPQVAPTQPEPEVAPFLHMQPDGTAEVVGFVTTGFPSTKAIRQGLRLLAFDYGARIGAGNKGEANVKDAPKGPKIAEVLADTDPVALEKLNRNRLLDALKGAGVSAYLLATAMMRTEVDIHVGRARIDAQAPANYQRDALKRVAEFAELAASCVEEATDDMRTFALAHAMTRTIRLVNGDGKPTDTYVIAGILGRLLKYLTGVDTGKLLSNRRIFGDPSALMTRPLTETETKLLDAYVQLPEIIAAEAEREG